MLDIMWFMPENAEIKVWDNTYIAYLNDWKYVLNEAINEYLEADNVYIYMNNELFDTIDKRICLRAWDTLHLEYSLHVR
jgi:hypothetical protein